MALSASRPRAEDRGQEVLSVNLDRSSHRLLLLFQDGHDASGLELHADAVDAEGGVTPLIAVSETGTTSLAIDDQVKVRRVRFSYTGNTAPAMKLEAVAIEP